MDLVNIPLSCIGRGFTLDDPGEALILSFLSAPAFLSTTFNNSAFTNLRKRKFTVSNLRLSTYFYLLLPSDADVWGIITLAIATCYYFQYNLIMYYDANDTSHASLYLYGDYWYVVNAFIYTLCAMRDNECFWFMPCNGRPQGCIEAARSHYFSPGNDGDGDGPIPSSTQSSNKFDYGKLKNSVSCSTNEDMEGITIKTAEERIRSMGLGLGSSMSMEDIGSESEGMNIDSNMGLLSNFLFSSPSSVTLRGSGNSNSSSSSSGSVKDPGKDRDKEGSGSGSGSGLMNNGSYTRRSE